MSGIGPISGSRPASAPCAPALVSRVATSPTSVADAYRRAPAEGQLRPLPTAVHERLQALSGKGRTPRVDPAEVASHMGSTYSKCAAVLIIEQLPACDAEAETDAAAAAAVADIAGYSSHQPWVGFTTAVTAGFVSEMIETKGPLPARLKEACSELPAHVIGAAAGTGSAFLGFH